ncbi:peptidylprolyl isomerase [Granulosicoccus antarcticus]|uniref:peptidylprolyl isomerase n=1 Tax=Granulosicoccus antarcticus IMCC3135 TaxID=1192854 RepID=A0A2Z2NQI3_9GAMM|nr:peptidylprolyl isomerase [Granulosicoccus antarcticus]ASJ73593.1 Putative peptidyl-prolyl cis-trans isomerase Cbf2 [Granulosicoccus antarcticus IMCC3135]
MDSLNQNTVETNKKQPIQGPVPSVNGIILITPDESLSTDELRQRACSEMLRQTAMQEGLLPTDDPAPEAGVMSEAASEAIESLLDRELQAAEEADESACRRYYEGHAAQFTRGERVNARHVLFAVVPGVDVNQLRKRAEACLLDLRCETPGDETNRFASVAGSTSNCPSGAEGGHLGWLTADDCAPEFSREIFGKPEIGVLPRLVHSRFGLHVIEVLEREAGVLPEFEAVRSAVSLALERQRYATALRQYLQLLAGQCEIEGVDLAASSDPLVQ